MQDETGIIPLKINLLVRAAAWEVWLDFMGILLYTISILSESKENMR